MVPPMTPQVVWRLVVAYVCINVVKDFILLNYLCDPWFSGRHQQDSTAQPPGSSSQSPSPPLGGQLSQHLLEDQDHYRNPDLDTLAVANESFRQPHSQVTDLSQPHNEWTRKPRQLNTFIELERNPSSIASTQFYKTFGTIGNEQLFSYVKKLPEHQRKKILVTGGAGFVGSHLVDSLMLDGHEVIVCDNFFTGRKSNIEHWLGHPNFELHNHDVVNPLTIEVNQIYHLASPASPVHYMSNPIKTIKTNTVGTINMLGLAKRVGARIVIASTSEIYGDPEIHPQSESYWGNTNTIGPRSCYDESKRLSESLAVAYNQRENVSIGIARIFNTYGPRMHPNDGRVVSNFIMQAVNNEPLTIYGTGMQTRSFQYVTDLVAGLKRLMVSDATSPVNLGNPRDEITVAELAQLVKTLLPESRSEIEFKPLPVDDPQRRKPDVSKAKSLLGWQPEVPLGDGLRRTISYFEQEMQL